MISWFCAPTGGVWAEEMPTEVATGVASPGMQHRQGHFSLLDFQKKTSKTDFCQQDCLSCINLTAMFRLPSWKNGALSLVRLYVLKLWRWAEFFTDLCVGGIISEFCQNSVFLCCSRGEIRQIMLKSFGAPWIGSNGNFRQVHHQEIQLTD